MMALFFLIVALIYSMVGMGGGSSYIAIMALSDMPYHAIPLLARLCNLIVVSGTTYHFVRQGYFSWSRSWPLIAGAVPMAFLGAAMPLSKPLFLLLLGGTLLILGLKLLFVDRWQAGDTNTQPFCQKKAFFIGSLLGLLSGLTGIGGGIFLVPILHLLRWGDPKQIAASGSVFILVGSVAGLAGQACVGADFSCVTDYWILLLAVFCGGQLGSFLGATILSQNVVKKSTGVLVFYVGARLLLNVFQT